MKIREVGLAKRFRSKVARALTGPAEALLRSVERTQLSRSASLQHIPPPSERGGGLGTTTYAEWCYTIGLFQTLIFQNLPSRPVRMLDVGCGVGRMYLSAKPYLMPTDTYLGIDISKDFIAICDTRHTKSGVSFLHTPASNAYYAGDLTGPPVPWPIANASYNLVTALSVWTHLREEDWRFYLREVSRVLTPGGRAIISFFVLDELYHPESKTEETSRFYPQAENKWIFDVNAYNSVEWKYPSWANVPEVAIALPKDRFDAEIEEAGLQLIEYLPGQWKDQPGFFFQDVAVIQKPTCTPLRM